MKNLKLFNQSLRTVGSPNQTGETLTRENRIGVKSWLNRGLMLLIMLLTLGVGQMWAEAFWPYAGFYEVYMTYSYSGNNSNYTFYASDNNSSQSVDLGTLTADFKVTALYMKCYKNTNDWNKSGNICGALMIYNTGSGDNEYQPTWAGYDTDKGWSDTYQAHLRELSKTGCNKVIASYNSGASGSYTANLSFKMWGSDDNGSDCGDNWWISNNSNNYKFKYKIAPPAVKSGTLSVSATNVVSGTGTEGDPFVITYGSTTQFTVSGTQDHADANSSIKGGFGTSTISSSATSSAYTPTTSAQSLTIYGAYVNSTTSSLKGASSNKTIYYKWADPAVPTLSMSSVSPATLVEGNTVTINVTRSNSSAAISYEYKIGDGSWTSLTPASTSNSGQTATWAIPEANGATRTFYFRATMSDGGTKTTAASDPVTVYGKKTIHVRNTNDWATFKMHHWGDANATTYPGGTDGISATVGQWKDVVILSSYTGFILNDGNSGSGRHQSYDLGYTTIPTSQSVTDGSYWEFATASTSADGANKHNLTLSSAPAAPTATTNDANEITSTTAKFNYSVNANRDKTTPGIAFKQSDDDIDAATIYSSGTKVAGSATNENASGSTAAQTTTPGKKYYYVAYGTNGFGTSYGTVKSFVAPYKVSITKPTGCSAITPGTGTQYVHIGDEISSTATIGYTFSSWSVTNVTLSSPTTTEGVTRSTITAAAENGTIAPVYTENMTTVNLIASPTGKGTFTSGGDPVTSVSAGVDTHPTVTAVPATGYRLTGTIWSESSDYISITPANAAATTITATGTTGNTANLTATFTPITYTVHFNGNGETSGEMSNQTGIAYDAATTLTANAFVKTGYNFAGWATTAEKAAAGTVDRTDRAAHGNLSSKQDATVNLYAVWTPKQSALTINMQSSAEGYGSDGTATASASATYGADMPSLTGTLPTAAEGYAFMGFYDAAGGAGTQYYTETGASARTWDKDTGSGTTLYAYYKKAEITTLALSAETVEPSSKVTATATVAPTPTGDTHIDWKLLYSNGSVHSSQPSEFSSTAQSVEFTVPEASGSYKVLAQLRKGTTANAGDFLSEQIASFVVAGTHTVTIQYKCGDVTVKSSTVVEDVKPLEWSEKITPGEAPFGYTFTRWEAGDGVTISTDGTSAIVGTTTTTADIYIKAIYDGRLTAVYTKKNIIYFKNTLEWSDVYVNLYPNTWWNPTKGAGNNTLANEKRNKHMTQIGESDIWYYEYGSTETTAYISFTDRSQNNYEGFAGTSGSNKVKVSYPTKPDATATEDANYGFNAGTPMFVPIEQTAQPWNQSEGVDLAEYYNKGYWRTYDPTTGESGSTGYTLKIYNKTEDSSRELLQSIPFTNADASGQIFKATINLEAATGYGIKVERDNSLMYTNTTGHLNNTGDVETLSVNPDNHKAIYILTTAAGDYDFIITCNGSGQLCLQATFPAAANDYRVLYTDDATWSNTAHTARIWAHPSRVISAKAGATDTISFFVSKDNSPEYKIQKVNSINEGTGAITWTDVTSWTSISVDKTGVYNFIFTQPSAGSISLSKTEAYTGNFYIRTDNAGSTKWENYREEDHKMTYSEYAAKITHTGEEWKDFTHYFMKYVDKDKDSGKYKNVKFTVANDYSPCISDTLVQQAGDVSVTPSYTHVDAYGNLQANANIRFMWNIKNNKLQRAYLAAAKSDGSNFLVLQGEADKLLDKNGNALLNSANYGEAGYNHKAPNNAIQFTDKEHWMYEAEVKAKPGGRVKLYATYNSSTFYYYGDNTASFTGTSAIDLVSGSGDAQSIRVVYDFKTDRLIAAWMPSDGDISAPQTVNADIMLIREHQEQGKQINLVGTGSIKTNKTVYGVMRFNRWTLNNKSTAAGHAVLPVGEQKSQYERFNYFISFPFDVKVGEIFGFGTIGRHYRIFYYDGLGRAQQGFFAERGDDNWRMIDDTDSILHANQGYLLQLNYIRMADDNTETWPQASMNEVELYFPAMGNINTISLKDVVIPALGDAYRCTIDLSAAHGGNTEADRRIKDSYWRCIGVPGFTSYEANDTWENFNWTTDADDMPYLYEWHPENNSLSVVSSSTFTFKPMHAYLIQNGNSFKWSSVAVPSSSGSVIARRQAPASEDSYYEFLLTMQQGEEELDHTFVRMTNNESVTTAFDFGHDLSKELNEGCNLYTKIGYERLAANCLPTSEQTTVIPVGVKVTANADYTFAIPDGTSGVGVTLIDNLTGVRTNLSAVDYTVSLEEGTCDDRFVLEISPIKHVYTDISEQQADINGQQAESRKVLIDGLLYIVRDNKIYDARGARVQ